MALEHFAVLSRREMLRTALLLGAVVAGCLWISFQLLEPVPPRRIVLASGVESGLYHKYALRYRAALAKDGVTLEIRTTNGAGENYNLLLDPKSGVDVAFLQGGIARMPEAEHLAMLAALYYEALWVFHRPDARYTKLNELKGLRIAIGAEGSGARAFALPLLAANGLDASDATFLEAGGDVALAMVREGKADAAVLVGGGAMASVHAALHDASLVLMTLPRAPAYVRRFAYISHLTLPPGTIDLARDIPPRQVDLIGTKAMLAARDTLHPALINLLLEAVRDEHNGQGYFETAGEFPNSQPVDIPVSPDALRHQRFGPSFLYRTLPFWVAAFVERTIILVVPLLVVLIPLVNFFPQFLRWRVRSRVYRWYGELALLEREVAQHQGLVPLKEWLSRLDRIERAVADIRIPASFASEAYTLREHVVLVREAIVARAAADRPAAGQV